MTAAPSPTGAATRRETTIEADPDVPLIRITREFDAPAAKVFRAHTDPDLLVRWLGPRDIQMEVDRWDCRSGGEWRYVHRREGEEHGFRGTFHDVVEDQLIVQTFCYEPMADGVALERMVFEDLGDGRSRIVATSLCDSFEGRDAWLRSGMETGVNQGYEQLDELLAG
jgi:uncharacterized protein YndB with AHSA1/START domain